MPITCPPDAEIYFDQVSNRCREFIRLGLWTIEPGLLNGWLSNFETREDRHLAASLLDRCVFRSELQVRSMILQLLQRTLSDALAPVNQFGTDWQTALGDSASDPGVRLVPVIRDSDSPAKSGPLVARLFRRLGGVADQWMIWPWLMKDHTDVFFILIDDFVGSGDQFIKFCQKNEIQNFPKGKVVYAPLIAHPDGVSAIAQKFPNVLLVPGEILTTSCGILDDGHGQLDSHNHPRDARAQYFDYWRRRGTVPGKKLLWGWDKLSLTIAFNHGTPNASLPIFWMNKGDAHKPLFPR